MYLPGIETIAGQSAGAMAGGRGRKLLLHSTEGSTIEGAVGAYRARNVWPHLTVDCPRRRAVQHLPLQLAGRSLKNKAGGVETNRAGQYLVQIELVGFAGRPHTIGDVDDLDWFAREVVRPIHEATGVPLHSVVDWVPYPASYGEGARQRVAASRWADLSGIVGHQHAPENDHGDPGALDVARIIATATSQEDDMPLTEDDIPVIRKALRAELAEEGSPSRTVLVELLRKEFGSEAGRLNQALDLWAKGAGLAPASIADAVAAKITVDLTDSVEVEGVDLAEMVRSAVGAGLAPIFSAAATAATAG